MSGYGYDSGEREGLDRSDRQASRNGRSSGRPSEKSHASVWKLASGLPDPATPGYRSFRYLAGGMPTSRLKALRKATPDS